MNPELDTFSIDLVVTACQWSADDVWMQGDFEIRLNGERPYAIDDIVDVVLVLESMNHDGEYFIFSCCCGVPECSGWKKGIEVSHSENLITWTNLNTGKTWRFDKQRAKKDLEQIREESKNYKTFFDQKGIKYVGAGSGW